VTGLRGRHRAAVAGLLILAGVLAAGGAYQLAAGHAAAGIEGVAAAFLGVVAAMFARLNWQVLEVNRTLIEMNRDLLERAKNTDSRPA
jgi:hypothetical protein